MGGGCAAGGFGNIALAGLPKASYGAALGNARITYPADDGGGQREFVNRSRHVIIAPVDTIGAAVRRAQASAIHEGISAAIPALTEPLGRRMDDQAMVITGRMNATDKVLQAVLAQASATDRQLNALQAGLAEERRLRDEDKLRHSQEIEDERKRVSEVMASAAFT